MNITIPFKKQIPFKSSIAEICSISLEHDVSINESELLGDFIISGEYKNLQVNVDTMPFEHVIPFSVNLDKDIIIDSLNYEVEDFTYEIENEDTLCVNILFHVTADKIVSSKEDSIFEKEEVDRFYDEDITKLIKSDKLDKEELVDSQNQNNVAKSVVIEKNIEEEKNSVDIIKNSNIKEDYITYHIHIVKVNETIDQLASLYKISKEKLMELNDINNIEVGDKIIIPDLDEQ